MYFVEASRFSIILFFRYCIELSAVNCPSFFVWKATFNFALDVFFLPLTSFTVCHFVIVCSLLTLQFYWFDIECILIALFFFFFFWYALISSFWAFLQFFTLEFIRLLLSIKDDFLKVISFFQTTNAFHRTLLSAFSLIDMHSAAASTWVVIKFSYSSFG